MNLSLDYTPELDLKTTLIALNEIKIKLIHNLITNFDLIVYPDPLITEFNSGLNGFNDFFVSRSINFDAKNLHKICELLTSVEQYKRWILNNYNFLPGIIFTPKLIFRDNAVTNTSSLFYTYISYEKFLSEWFNKQDLFNHALKSINLIFNQINTVRFKFNLKDQLVINTNKVFSYNEIYKEYKKFSINEIFDHIGEKHGSFFINGLDKNEINHLLSLSYAAYDWNLLYTFFYYYPRLSMSLPLAVFSVKPDYQTLIDQRSLVFSKDDDDLTLFDKAVQEKKLKVTYGVTINLEYLQLIALDKIHLAEVQSSIWQDKDYVFFKKNSLNWL